MHVLAGLPYQLFIAICASLPTDKPVEVFKTHHRGKVLDTFLRYTRLFIKKKINTLDVSTIAQKKERNT
jgi:hypothetical protein